MIGSDEVSRPRLVAANPLPRLSRNTHPLVGKREEEGSYVNASQKVLGCLRCVCIYVLVPCAPTRVGGHKPIALLRYL